MNPLLYGPREIVFRKVKRVLDRAYYDGAYWDSRWGPILCGIRGRHDPYMECRNPDHDLCAVCGKLMPGMAPERMAS